MKKMRYIFFILLFGALLAGCGPKEQEGDYFIEYLDQDKSRIIRVPYETDTKETLLLVEEFLNLLKTEPEKVGCRKPIPDEVEVSSYSLDGAMLTIWFDKDYYRMKNVEELLCRAAIVRTLTQIPEVSCVTFYANDEPLKDAQGNVFGIMYPESFVENPGEQINSIQDATLTLYFANEAGNSLVKEVREVHYSSNISMEKLIMEQLLKGPETEGLKSAIPAGTKLVSVSAVEGICYVNLDATFKNQDYSVMEPIVIYSIVNSLSEMTSINKVQISVNGDTSGAYRDSFLLSEMYVRNLDYVAASKEEAEQSEGTEMPLTSERTEEIEKSEKKEAKR